MPPVAQPEPLHLLRTKLYRPRPAGDLVQRARLHELLDRYLGKTLILVCAPAGFGKTTLLSQWLERCPCPSAWLSLDKSDGDLAVFLAYFTAAVRTMFPSACADTLGLLQAPVLPPLPSLVAALTNDLDRLGGDEAVGPASSHGDFIVVLDDYHLVREPAVHALLRELLRHPPRTLHLVVGSRQDPPFLEYSVRARGDFSEIRGAELRFTDDEVASFMQQALQTPLEQEEMAHLTDRTEGWGTGLRLAALALNSGGAVTGSRLATDNRYTSDYLIAEVLSRVPAATQDFLLMTSILDRMTGPLCDAVVPPAEPGWDGRGYLEWLAAENAFTFSLDAHGSWYRYHHLFQRLLREQLERRCSKAEIARLHERAAEWFAQNGLIQEAIEHALAAGNELMAIGLVEMHRHEAMNRELWRQLEQWLGLLPRRLIDARPELLMLEAWIVQNQWRFGDLPGLLDRIEALMLDIPLVEGGATRLSAEADTLRSMASYYQLDFKRSVVCAERALARLPIECSSARGAAYMYLASGRVIAGDVQGGIEVLYDALKEDRVHGDGFPTRPYTGICLLYWMRADPVNLFLAATQLLQLAQQRNLVEAKGIAHYFRGCARYEQNDLAAAREEFTAAVNVRYLTHAFAFSQSSFGLVLTLAGLGEHDRACEVLDSAAAYGLEMHNGRVIADAEAIRACLARRVGAVAVAHRWAASFDADTPLVPLTTFSVPHLVRARVLVADGSPASLATAARDLARLHDMAASTYNTRALIEVLALEALMHDGLGNQLVAFDTLEEALRLAEPGNIVRVFADLGPRMGALLGRHVARSGITEYRQRLLVACGEPKQRGPAGSGVLPVTDSARAAQVGSDGLIEPLSSRELDVLLLLSERLTDKEIARQLVVSPQTVKRHAANIYQKLDVGNRREAVVKATAFGLLQAPPLVPRRSFSTGQ